MYLNVVITLVLCFCAQFTSASAVVFEENTTLTKLYKVDCSKLRMGQYLCPDPHMNHIDTKTQQLKGCTKENKALGNN